MSVRVMKVTHTTTLPIVEVVAESVDEALTIDVQSVSMLSKLILFVTDEESSVESMYEYILSPSGEWIAMSENAPAIAPSDDVNEGEGEGAGEGGEG